MYQYHTLANGLRVVFRPADSRVVYTGVYIQVGSRDETGDEEGMAHFIEHSIFKGTEHRRAYHILNRIDGVGGELNAFTTKEETCIYASALTGHLERCIELFADVLFHSVFPKREIENEKDVVIEEINSYSDSPAEQIYDDFEELIFAGHPLAHNILGSKRNVRRFSSASLAGFMRRHYTPDRMVLSVVGNVPFARVVRLVERYFGRYASAGASGRTSQQPRLSQFDRAIHRRTHQTHLLIGGEAPDLFAERKVAFTLLNNIMGGPAMNSRLNMAVREKHGFCYSIESQYVPLTDSGLFYIYAGIENGMAERVKTLVFRELEGMCNRPLSSYQMRVAQRQLIGQMAVNNDSLMNEMQSIGKACLNYGRVDTIEEMSRDVMQLTPADLQEVARAFFVPSMLSILCYHP